jgi:3-oxoacyl-[acyl-carrier-protein] synthase II
LGSGLRRSVVITGAGTVGSYGCGVDPLARALASGTPAFSEVDRSGGYHRDGGARLAALVTGQDLSAWVPAGAARRMSTPSRFAVAAARMALEHAAGPVQEAGPTAVVLSTAFGPSSFTERILRGLQTEGPEATSPFLFTESVANAPAAQVAISCAAQGPNITVTQREAGPFLAVARGAAEVAAGRAARALVGAVDEMTPMAHAILDRFGALARPAGACGETARPYDRHRNGIVAAEGATVLVLEDEAGARARGAPLLARVSTSGSAFDPTASRVGWGRGHDVLARALRNGLERAGLGPSDIDRIVSGASGSVAGDRAEGLALRAAWADAPLPVLVAPKGVTGEYGGGFLAATVLALNGGGLGPTAGFQEPDPEMAITPHRGGPLPPATRVLALALAAGGSSAWLVLERP